VKIFKKKPYIEGVGKMQISLSLRQAASRNPVPVWG